MWKIFEREAICARPPWWRPQRRRPTALPVLIGMARCGPDIKSQFWAGLYIANVENVENIWYESIFVNAHLDGALNAGAHPLVLI